MNNIPKRKANRIKDYDYSSAGVYFITLCTQDRVNVFWNTVGADIIRPLKVPLSPTGKLAETAIVQIKDHYDNVSVDHYCIMPNHIHMIIRIMPNNDGRIISAPTLSTVVGSMKRWISKQLGRSIWQKSFYEHIIRDREDYETRKKYIYDNPLKWYYNH